jgi:hypothetical protein
MECMLLFVGLIGLFRLCRFYFRVNDGLGAFFRWNAFGSSAPSRFLSLYRSLPTVSYSLIPTEWRPRSTFSTKCIRLTCSPFFSFSLSVSPACSISVSLSLPTEWWLTCRRAMAYIQLQKTERRETELALLLSETPSDSPRSLSLGCLDIVASNRICLYFMCDQARSRKLQS